MRKLTWITGTKTVIWSENMYATVNGADKMEGAVSTCFQSSNSSLYRMVKVLSIGERVRLNGIFSQVD